MLRNIVFGIAVLLFAGAAVAFVLMPQTIMMLLFASVLLLGTVFERIGYGRASPSAPAGRDWQETAERLIDPESGRLVSVWFDPATGERRYVDNGTPPFAA